MEDTKKELTLERTYDAPIDLVWKAWTDPKLVAEWWGPQGVTSEVNEWIVQPDGKLDLVMVAGEALGPMAGQRWPMNGEFKEIEEPSKISFIGNAIVDGKEVMQSLTTVTFEETDGKTHMTVHIQVTKTTPEAAGPLSGMEMGWNQQLDKLGEFLKK
ncbi:MAG TPA: SRPBCC domain-containing protein [Candidatus Saccharimonadales bacterium]|nr:SRPBCC domain-containing protein [Candidatus Saccharimonadales bacterium]